MKIYPNTLLAEVEFDFIRQRVAKYAVTAAAQSRLLHLLPFDGFDDAQSALIAVNEVLALYETGTAVPALSPTEVDAIFLRLKMRNAVLSAEECLQIKELVDTFNNLLRYFGKQRDLAPSAFAWFADTAENKAIPEEIDRVFDPKGEVKSSASEALKQIRQLLAQKKTAADRLFYKVAKRYEAAGLLGQISESVYDNRRVLAVNAAYKSRARGILHGSSAKHSLLFVEPQETVEINNEITLLQEDEAREIKRILKLLSQFLAGYLFELQHYTSIIREIDFVNAKARFAYAEKAVLPNLSKRPGTELVAAINPVLRHFNQPKKKKVIPLDAKLDGAQRILVISGPNAGGKSITLKTIGLLQLMMQSGLLVPVNARSIFGWYGSLMGDIGDAQSIENELSTYSSKLSKMQVILEESTPNTLVLLDEFGSGSDPDLGSALAQVFLETLNNTGVYGVLTTHYNSIKALADSLPGVANANMAFDTQTFAPDYTLNVGTPGSSYTFEVAKRVGISMHLIKAAKQKLDDKTVAIDRLLVGVQREKNELTSQREKLQARLEELSALKDKHTGKIAQLETKLQKMQTQIEQQAETLRWGKRFESLVNSYAKERTQKKRKEILDRMMVLVSEHAGTVKKNQQKAKRKQNKKASAKLLAQLAEPVAVADKVKLLATNRRGTILEIRKEQYHIALGDTLSTWVSRDKFVKAN